MSRDEITAITDQCFNRHKKDIDASNLLHEKRIKKAIFIRVSLPIGVLCMLCAFVLGGMFKINGSVIKHQTETNIKVDLMGKSVMEETGSRRESDSEIKTSLKEMETKLDQKLEYLYRNSTFKERGSIPWAGNKGGNPN